MIEKTFLNQASDVIGHTTNGLSGRDIVNQLNKYALIFRKKIPFAEYPFQEASGVGNKRSALRENLKAFTAVQQFQIIKELCELSALTNNIEVANLKTDLILRYSHLCNNNAFDKINRPNIKDAPHWLDNFPNAKSFYQSAEEKFENKVFQRAVLDDLKLSFEALLKSILDDGISLEKQPFNSIGSFLKRFGASKEANTMIIALSDYFSKYQDIYVKHNDLIFQDELEFIFETTSSFMRFLVRMRLIDKH